MKTLTFTGKHVDEPIEREVELTLNNTSETDQKVILIDSPAFKGQSKQIVKGILFGDAISVKNEESQKLASLKDFASISPVHVKSISIDSDSVNQISEDVVVSTPVLFDSPIVEVVEGKMRKGGADYELPSQVFIGEGAEISFLLKALTAVKVKIKLGCYDAKRLV